jgi:hypothetical protein
MSYKIQIIFVLLLGFSLNTNGQLAFEDCNVLLKKAKYDFEIGKVDRVESWVSGCLTKQLSSSLRMEILELLIEASLFLDEDEKAEKYYRDLKTLDPFAKLNNNVPETVFLTEKFETFPSTTFSFHLGATPNLIPIDLDGGPEGLDITSLDLKRGKGDLLGWFIGTDVAFNVNNSRLDASIGYTFHKNYSHYKAALENAVFDIPTSERSPAILSFREQTHWSNLALGLVYQFKKRDRFEKRISPYLFVRLGGLYLHNKSSKIYELAINFPDKEVVKTDPTLAIGDMRSKFVLSAKAGAAVRIRIYRHLFAQGGVVYHRILTNIGNQNVADPAYNLLAARYNFQDDDFTAHQFGFFVGFGYYLFKTKKK